MFTIRTIFGFIFLLVLTACADGISFVPSTYGNFSLAWTPKYSAIVQYFTLQGSGSISNASAIPAAIGSNGVAINANGSGMSYGEGANEPGITFDGVDDYIDVPGTSAFQSANTTFSVSLWFNLPSSGSTGFLFSKGGGNGGASGSGFSIAVLSGGDLQVTTKDNSGFGTISMLNRTNSAALLDGSWHHLVAVLTTDTSTTSHNTIQIYIDGNLNQVGTTYSSGLPYAENTTNDFGLGARATTSSGSGSPLFLGSLNEVAVFNSGLSASDVSTIYLHQKIAQQ